MLIITMLDFNDIHAAYHDRVLRYIRGIAGDEHAEDFTQEVFIKIHRGLDSLRDEKKLSSWIYSIALNTARDGLRSMKAGPRIVSLDKDGAPDGVGAPRMMEHFPDPRARAYEDILAKKEMAQCYVDFVKKLPPNYFEIYVLSEFEGLPDAEIASRLSLSLRTVKVRLHRARTRLYDELRKNCTCYNDKSGELMCEPKK